MKRNKAAAKQLGDWLRDQKNAGVIKLNLDGDGDVRDFDCNLCGLNFDLHSTKHLTAAAFVAAHIRSCTISHPRAP